VGSVGERLTERQETVLRALVRAYVGGAAPVGSAVLSHTMPVRLSSASIRNTMAELTEMGLIEQPHASAGRVPTEAGLRRFVDELLGPLAVSDWERRYIEAELGRADAEASLRVATDLLARRTQSVGFALLPRLDRAALGHVSLIRVSNERVLAVLVSRSGVPYQRVLPNPGSRDQRELERVAAELNRRLVGQTLSELRVQLEREAERLRRRAGLLLQTLMAAVRTLAAEAASRPDVVLTSATALLDRPEFHDPERVRALLEALETTETLAAFVGRVLGEPGVAVTFGSEVELPQLGPALRDCAVVSAACGGQRPPGMLGVLGPTRMDYPRVIPLVELFSQLVTEKLSVTENSRS